MVGILDEVETMLSTLCVQSIAGLHVLKLYGTAYIASYKFLNLDTGGTCTAEQLSHALLAATVGIGKVITLVHLTLHNLEVLHLANMGLNSSLEYIKACGGINNGSHLLATGIVNLRHLVYEGNHIAQELHQAANAHALACANTEYGEHATCSQTLTDTLTHLVLCQALVLEELLHQGLVMLGSSLYQRLVHLHGLVHLLCGNVLDCGLATFGTP